MKAIREFFASVKGRSLDEVSKRLTNTNSLIWLGLFVLSVLLQVAFNLPAALSPALALLPHGSLCVLTFLGFCCSSLGVKRGLAASAAVLAVFGPLAQPLLAIPCILVFAGAASYLVASRGYKRPLLAFALSVPLTFFLYVLLAVVIVPVLHVATVAAWSTLSTVVALTLAAGTTALLIWRQRKRSALGEPSGKVRTIAGIAVLVGLWLFVPYTIVANRWEALVSLQLRHTMDPERVDGLIDTVQDRMLPRTTAETYMQNLNGDYMTSVEPPHLQERADSSGLWWQSAVHNDNRWGRIFGSATRVVAVDADRVDQHAEDTPNSGFIFSDKSWVTKATFAVRHPFSQMSEVSYYQNSDKSWSMLISYTTKRMTWTLPGPTVMVPNFGGVMEVTQNGVVRDWTVEQAAQRFPGAVLYPSALYRQQSEAYARWREGWTGAKILQQNVLEVSEDDSADATINRQPYVQHFKGLGLQMMIALEPKGDKQWALTEILLADVSTGKLRSIKPPAGLIGPRQARLSVRSSDTRIDWSHIRKVEPRLVVAPRGVFWLVAIVTHWENEPDRHPYVTSVLVDAVRTSDCYTFQHTKEMNEFLAQPRPKD